MMNQSTARNPLFGSPEWIAQQKAERDAYWAQKTEERRAKFEPMFGTNLDPTTLEYLEMMEPRAQACSPRQCSVGRLNLPQCSLDRWLNPGQTPILSTDGKPEITFKMCRPMLLIKQAEAALEHGVPRKYHDKTWTDYLPTSHNSHAISLAKAFVSKAVSEPSFLPRPDPMVPSLPKSTTPPTNVLTLPIPSDSTAEPQASTASSIPSPIKDSLYLYGGTGTGKTFLASLVAKEFWEKSCVFRDVPSLLAELKGTFGKNDLTQKFMARCEKTRLLILDDLGAGLITEWSVGILYEIINTRYNANRSVVVTGNYDFDGLERRLSVADKFSGSRIISRLKEMCSTAYLGEEDRRCL